MSSDSSDEADEIPSRAICEERSQKFASLTGTDSALAFCLLQKNKWSLEKAVDAYYAELQKDSSVAKTSEVFRGASDVRIRSISLGTSSEGGSSTSQRTTTPNNNSKTTIASDTNLDRDQSSDPQPHRVRVMSWNIDGLDTNNLLTRTRAVCSTILQEKPDVVFLQEVVPQTLELLEECCPAFQVIPGGQNGYFTAMMLSIQSVVYEDHDIKQFHSSLMSRNIITCQAKVKGVPMHLLTSHLESTKDHGKERKKQLQMLLKEMTDSGGENCVIAAGDLNLRDKELQEIGGLPENVFDIWEVTGKRPEAKFTWDLMRNDNLEWPHKFKPRSRFDRMYLRHPVAKATEGASGRSVKPKLKPRYFELVGIERVKACRRFPSDHWGILAHFDKI